MEKQLTLLTQRYESQVNAIRTQVRRFCWVAPSLSLSLPLSLSLSLPPSLSLSLRVSHCILMGCRFLRSSDPLIELSQSYAAASVSEP